MPTLKQITQRERREKIINGIKWGAVFLGAATGIALGIRSCDKPPKEGPCIRYELNSKKDSGKLTVYDSALEKIIEMPALSGLDGHRHKENAWEYCKGPLPSSDQIKGNYWVSTTFIVHSASDTIRKAGEHEYPILVSDDGSNYSGRIEKKSGIKAAGEQYRDGAGLFQDMDPHIERGTRLGIGIEVNPANWDKLERYMKDLKAVGIPYVKLEVKHK